MGNLVFKKGSGVGEADPPARKRAVADPPREICVYTNFAAREGAPRGVFGQKPQRRQKPRLVTAFRYRRRRLAAAKGRRQSGFLASGAEGAWSGFLAVCGVFFQKKTPHRRGFWLFGVFGFYVVSFLKKRHHIAGVFGLFGALRQKVGVGSVTV